MAKAKKPVSRKKCPCPKKDSGKRVRKDEHGNCFIKTETGQRRFVKHVCKTDKKRKKRKKR